MIKITLFTPPFVLLSFMFSCAQANGMEEKRNSEVPAVRNNREATPVFPIRDHSSSELDLSQNDDIEDLCRELQAQPAPCAESPRTRYRASLGEKKLQQHRQMLQQARIAREIAQQADHNISIDDPDLFNELATYEAVSRSLFFKDSSPESRSTHSLKLPLAPITSETDQESARPPTPGSSRSVFIPRTLKNSPKSLFLIESPIESPKEEQKPSPRSFTLSIKKALLQLSQKKRFPTAKSQESPKSDEDQE